MIKNLAYRLLGGLLLVFCGTTWAWMLGAFLPADGLGVNSAKWVAPGILAMPGTIAVIAGLIGFLFVLGVLPLSQADESVASKENKDAE